jgi:glycosyltransferase involved in cell wall biosynthesis
MSDQPIKRSTDQRQPNRSTAQRQPIRIGVDATCWTQRRGYGRHLRGLITAAAALHTRHQFVLFTDFAGESIFPFPSACQVVAVPTGRRTLQAASADGARSLSDMWALGRAMSAAHLDLLLFPTIYSWVPTWTPAPKLLMIHDVIAERFPRHIFPSLSGRVRWQLKSVLGLAQADAVLTVSEYSRRALATQFGIPSASIAVVGEAPDPVFQRQPAAQLPSRLFDVGLRANSRIIAYVGGFGPHKNLCRLLDAFAKVAAEPRFADVMLALTGDYSGDAFHSEYPRLRRRVDELGLRARAVFTAYLADDELVALLNCSSFLALPSLMEGYGLPAVEAAACGLPVLVTRNSPIPELLRGGAIAVDPDRTEAIHQAMVRLLEDGELRGRMGQAAKEAAEELTWEQAGRELVQLVESLCRTPLNSATEGRE